MEKGTVILRCEVKIGERYSYESDLSDYYTFEVLSEFNNGDFIIKYTDGVKSTMRNNNYGFVYANPLTELEKALS